jgi:phage/plasmid-associated DNA primase
VSEISTVTTKALYEAYEGWARDNGDKPISKKMFGLKLNEHGFDSYRATGGVRTYMRLSLVENEA